MSGVNVLLLVEKGYCKYIDTCSVDPDAEDWPPKDPGARPLPEVDPNYVFTLPESPWTYDTGNLNPNLHPSGSASTTRRRSRKSSKPPISSVPPYHPDYKAPSDDGSFSDTAPSTGETSGEDGIPEHPRRLVRRGSEGYEVRGIDREAMLRQYISEQMREPGRYNVYMPDPPSESEDDDEDTPIASKVERWRTESAMA